MGMRDNEIRLQSPEELNRDADNFEFYDTVPLTQWLRTAQFLQRQVTTSEKQGDLSKAYMLATRHATLVIQKLPLYPKDERDKHKVDLKSAFKQVSVNLPKLEAWKPLIRAQYERELQALRIRKAATLRKEEQAREAADHAYDDLDDFQDRRDSLDALEHRHVARELAQSALSQRQSSQLTPSSANDKGISAMMQDTRRLLDRQQTPNRVSQRSDTYRYPEVPSRRSPTLPAAPPDTATPPTIPQKLSLPYRSSPLAPAVPDKTPSTVKSVKFKIEAYTEGGEALRTVFLPSRLQNKFQNLADRNTSRDLETCGVLCASLVSNALMITHLVIPDQTSTSDTCDTTEEGDNALFDFCDKRDLIVCGWIHTHPSQTCFLSSRDLHTSAGYQLMLPEAIAIVCSPRHNPSLGIFRLTSPPGLPAVLKCQTKGLFHTHDETDLYTDASRPGHVVEDTTMDFEVVDLRTK